MARRKQDRIDIAVREAQKRGMSYGCYMAWKRDEEDKQKAKEAQKDESN